VSFTRDRTVFEVVGHDENLRLIELDPVAFRSQLEAYFSHVTPKAPRRRQATLSNFARQNTGACIPFEGNFQFRS
jgi:hypothetical protein